MRRRQSGLRWARSTGQSAGERALTAACLSDMTTARKGEVSVMVRWVLEQEPVRWAAMSAEGENLPMP